MHNMKYEMVLTSIRRDSFGDYKVRVKNLATDFEASTYFTDSRKDAEETARCQERSCVFANVRGMLAGYDRIILSTASRFNRLSTIAYRQPKAQAFESVKALFDK